MYKGPAVSLDAVIQGLAAEGYLAERASDLDRISFQAHSIDAETGAVTPAVNQVPPPPGRALYLLILDSYPINPWLEDLDRAGVRFVQELPRAGYVVFAQNTVITELFRTRRFVRNVIPLAPEMKKVLFREAGASASPRRVHIETTEEIGSGFEALLGGISREPVSRSQIGKRIIYTASLPDLDVDLIANAANVLTISPVLPVAPSSERQGVLVIQPTVHPDGKLSLPSTNPSYGGILTAKGITDFANTRIGIVDTGFDVGSASHPDFPSMELPAFEASAWAHARDRDLHGTLVASVVSGYTLPGQRTDPEGYRFSLGLAPTAATFVDKLNQCGGSADFDAALDGNVKSRTPSVVNLSFNSRGDLGGCNYGLPSRDVDLRTRSENWLFTISGGNLTTIDAGPCLYVRDPGTAKNAITAGATMGYNPFGSNTFFESTCMWNSTASDWDARNIPSFSAPKNASALALVKPDLVAPAVKITGPVSRVVSQFPAEKCGSMCNEAVAGSGLDFNDGFSAGTSFAAPAVAGAAAVVRKWFSILQGGDPSPAMTKAMLINGARDLGPAPGVQGARVLAEGTLQPIGPPIGNIPNDYQGWGMLSLDRLLRPGAQFYFYDQGAPLLPGATIWQKQLRVADASHETRITLVWTDAPSDSGNQNYRAFNDLDLSVLRPGTSQSWYGNRLSGGYSIVNPTFAPDAVNVVEQVIVPANTFAAGDVLILTVDPRAILSVGGQDFALFGDNLYEPALSFHTLAPCRVFDSRNPDGTYGGPVLTANNARSFPVAGQCGVPLGAKAISVNVTVVGPSLEGVLRLWPANLVSPQVGVVYYSPDQTRANNSLLPVDSTTSLAIMAVQTSGTAHGVVDINGYFE